MAAAQQLPFGPQRSPIVRELARKTFHLLSLIYLAAYKLIGWPAVKTPMLVWWCVVVVVESARLLSPALNRGLTRFFGGLAREDESDKFSGIFHTTTGVLILYFVFGARPDLVAAGIYFVAFGDAAAALVGKAWGRHKLPGGAKSYEGSAACFAACAISGAVLGFSPGAVLIAASCATVIELVPTTRWWNDNLWMPVITATVLKLCAAS